MIQKKICMLGSFAVGKTSLVQRFVQSTYSDRYHSTIGVKIDKNVWQRAADYWVKSQSPDGGWGYSGRPPEGYGSMTAAGIASLLICGNQVNKSQEHGYANGAAPNCGKYATSPQLAAGLNWLGQNFDIRRNPNHTSYHFYWLYALERAGMLTGLKYFGSHDWYREGATFLVGDQDHLAQAKGSAVLIDPVVVELMLPQRHRPDLVHGFLGVRAGQDAQGQQLLRTPHEPPGAGPHREAQHAQPQGADAADAVAQPAEEYTADGRPQQERAQVPREPRGDARFLRGRDTQRLPFGETGEERSKIGHCVSDGSVRRGG